LVDNLPGDVALAVERIDGHNAAFQRQHLQKFRKRHPGAILAARGRVW
jgi:hypothetical protein